MDWQLDPNKLFVDDRGYIVVTSFAHAIVLESSDRCVQ
jgi:hypothetical protein